MRKIEELDATSLKDNQKNVLRAFLFSCYTGLRFKDVSRLCVEHIVNGVIELQTSKTGSVVRIPVSKKALALIEGKTSSLFKLYQNHKTNKILGQLMILAGLSKKVTFHISRHTFATLSLNMGISMEVVSELLGHTSIRVTQLYAKILDKTKVEMMKKWDEMDLPEKAVS